MFNISIPFRKKIIHHIIEDDLNLKRLKIEDVNHKVTILGKNLHFYSKKANFKKKKKTQ